MSRGVLALFVCGVQLAACATSTQAPPRVTLSVRQFEIYSVSSTGRAIADRCAVSYPALKGKFDRSIETFTQRVGVALDALLETRRFRSLATATVPKELMENVANNAEVTRRTADVSEAECKRAISDLAMSDEQMRDILHQLLENQLAIQRLTPKQTLPSGSST